MAAKVIVTGVAGKMGGAILRLALARKDVSVVGATEAPGHPSIGKRAAEVAGGGDCDVVIADSLEGIIGGCDVVIDFTSPNASLRHFRTALTAGKGIVIGTTGFAPEAIAEIRGAEGARVVMSPNMSVGVNVMFDVAGRLARLLGEGYDIEITEMHHRWKKDAPSGTALRLKEAIQQSLPERPLAEIYGRHGITGERRDDEIAIHSLRGGDVVGDHTVTFAAAGERLEISHKATTRDNFARGAIVAANWLSVKPPGVYSMKEVLGL